MTNITQEPRHPPRNDDDAKLDYMLTTLSSIERNTASANYYSVKRNEKLETIIISLVALMIWLMLIYILIREFKDTNVTGNRTTE